MKIRHARKTADAVTEHGHRKFNRKIASALAVTFVVPSAIAVALARRSSK